MASSELQRNESGRILVGTASWSDPGFVQHWFPKGLAPADRLPWYAQHFEMVEVNSTFYANPELQMVERWCRSTPQRFLFDVKLHRLLSRHATVAKQLSPKLRAMCGARDNEKVQLTSTLESAALDEVSLLAEIFRDRGKLGTLLLQLSPAFSPKTKSPSELQLLISKLSAYSLAIEFRNRDWIVGDHADATFAFLRQHAVTLVLVDAPTKSILPSSHQI